MDLGGELGRMEFAWLEARHLKTGEKTFLIVGHTAQIVGRTASDDKPDKLSVGFDASLSRSHFWIALRDGKLNVQRCPEARRPLFVDGRAEDRFDIGVGEGFSSGQTLFRYVKETGPAGRPMVLDPTLLSIAHEQDASRGLRALLALQPLLRDAESGEALVKGTLSVLGEVVTQAASLTALEVEPSGTWSVVAAQGSAEVPPSRTLLRMALEQGKPVYHLWQAGEAATEGSPTMIEGVSWALAAPLVGRKESYVLYAVGTETGEGDGRQVTPGDLDRAVVALVADVVAGTLDRLQRWQMELDSRSTPG